MAGGHPNTDRGQHPRNAGAPQRPARTDRHLRRRRRADRCSRVRAAVAVPIIVDSRVWGLAAVGSLQHGPLPADTEVRISRFAELIATALVAGYRDEQTRRLLREASERWGLSTRCSTDGVDDWSLWEVAD